MKKLLVLAVALSVATGGLATAAETKPAAAPATEKKTDTKKSSKQQKVPFKGEVKKADQQAKCFAIGERTFHITSETRIQKDGKPATFQEVKVGEKVTGSYATSPEGRLEAISVFVGGKPAEATKMKEAKKEKGEPKAKKTSPKKEEVKPAEPDKGAPPVPEPKKDELAPIAPPPAPLTPPPAPLTPPPAPVAPAK